MHAVKADSGGTTITVLQGKSPHEIEFNREVRLTGGRFVWARRREPLQNGSKGSSGVPVAPGSPSGRALGNT